MNNIMFISNVNTDSDEEVYIIKKYNAVSADLENNKKHLKIISFKKKNRITLKQKKKAIIIFK